MAKANPSGCCGVAVGCCPNRVPETLTATFENVVDCACIDGMQVTLKWNPIDAQWQGSGPGGAGCALQSEEFRLFCAAPSSSCEHFDFVVVGVTPCLGKTVDANAGCTCDPLHLVFEFTLFGGIGCCNMFPGGGSIKVTVTE